MALLGVLNARERQRAVWLGAVSRALAATVLLTLLVLLLATLAGLPGVVRVVAGAVPLSPLQAVALAAAVGSIEAGRRTAAGTGRVQAALAAVVMLCGLGELASLARLARVGIADLDDTFGILLLGVGLLGVRRGPTARAAAEAALCMAALIGLATLVAFLDGTPTILPALDLNPMPVPLAYGLVALAGSALLAQGDRGMLSILLREDSGGRLARLLLPACLAVPPLLGFLAIAGTRRGLYDGAFGLTLVALASMVFALALVGWGARSASRTSGELRQEEERWRRLMDNVSEPIVTLDAQGRIQVANRATELLFERNVEELVGMPMEELLPPAQRPVLRDLLVPGASRTLQVQALRRDGREFPAEVSAAHWTGRDGTFYALVLRDATRRHMVEQALRAARQAAEAAARAKADFLANMSHEIRTPMNAVIGMTQLLGDTPLSAEQADYAKTIRSSGEHLMTIINDILDYSKIEAGKVELEKAPVHVRRFVEECLGIVASRAADKGLETGVLMGDAVPEAIVGDLARLRQVLLNLLSNAIKFTARGEVVVHVDAKPLGGGRHEVHVAVSDTGIGIPQDRFDRLFQSFSQVDSSTTRNYGGTGLGLAISKRLVEMMGGRIWPESVEGKGSTFHFTFSAEETQMPVEAQPTRASPLSLDGRRVLVVDDNATNRRILQAQLKKWGMQVEEATSGAEGLAAIAAKPYAIALIDHQMPEMDGAMLCTKIRETVPPDRLPLVVISSIGAKPEGYRPDLGIAAFLAKPVRQSQLLDAILLALSPGSAAPRVGSPAVAAQPRRDLLALLAEDNPVNQKVALKMLERLGVAADVANNGEEAVAAAKDRAYDVIFMDIQMPKLDGLQATGQIRALAGPRRPYIIAMTADAMPGDRERCLAAGMDDYVSKPVRMEALQAVLTRAGQVHA